MIEKTGFFSRIDQFAIVDVLASKTTEELTKLRETFDKLFKAKLAEALVM